MDIMGEEYVKEPKWILEIKSKVNIRAERQFNGMIFSLVLAMVIVFFIISQIEEHTEISFTILGWSIAYLVVIFILYFIMRKYYILIDTEYDSIDLFGFCSGKIGLDLERILLLPHYRHYLITNINALRTNSFFIRCKYRGIDYKEFRKNLKLLPKLSFNLLELIKDVNSNRDEIEQLSKLYLSNGYHIAQKLKKQRISADIISKILKKLESIEKPKKMDRVKSFIKSKLGFVIGIIIVAICGAFISYQLTSDIKVTIEAFVGLLVAIPAIYVIINKS